MYYYFKTEFNEFKIWTCIPKVSGKTFSGLQAETPISELKQYMDQMDRELSTTDVGKSFEKKQTTSTSSKTASI